MKLLDLPERDPRTRTASTPRRGPPSPRCRSPGGQVEVREIVGMLFADITGSTAPYEPLNSASARSWMERY